MTRLVFQESGHRYALDGKSVPSVTTLTGLLDKPALPKWAARSAAEWCANNPDMLATLGHAAYVEAAAGAPWAKRDKAAERGTRIHDAAEALITTGEITPADEDDRPLIEMAADFLDRWDATPILTESLVFADDPWFPYAGRLDSVARLRDGSVWLLDYKTGGVYDEHALQMAGYLGCTHYVSPDGTDVRMPEIDRVGIVQIKADHWHLFPVDITQDTRRAFSALLTLYPIRKGPSQIGAPLPVPEGVTS